jgi:hypothetical protein
MGKRELLIAAGFLVVGAIVFQFTAAPATESSSSFSFANFFDEARREVRGNPGRATATHTETLAVPSGVRELRVQRVARDIQVIGEDRADVEYALAVSSNGPDDETAKAYADRTRFERDDVADTMVLRVSYPEEASQQTSAIIKVPRGLAVRVENTTGVTISHVAAAHVEAARGSLTLTDVAGAVTGIHQDGSVTVTGAGSVKMRISRLRSTFDGVADSVILDVRDGDCTIDNAGGAVEVDSSRADVTINSPRGQVIVRGSDGQVTLTKPTAESRIDMRRTEVEVTIGAAVPITILTTDQTARVIVGDGVAAELDAVSVDGRIQATDVGLTPETVEGDAKLQHVFGRAGGARVTVRNTRGDIVIRK